SRIFSSVASEALLHIIHVPEEILAEENVGTQNGKLIDFTAQKPSQCETKKNAVEGEDFGERIERRENFEVRDLDRLRFGAQGGSALGERNIFQRSIERESNIGDLRAFVIQTNGNSLDVESLENPPTL